VANDTVRAEFIYENLAIAAHAIRAAHLHGSEKRMFLGSSCIYPKMATQPLRKDSVLIVPLEPINESYAIAKIAALRGWRPIAASMAAISSALCRPISIAPDDHAEYSHVVAALIRRSHEAKISGAKNVVVWAATGVALCRRYG
jgi:GDP-L-fucose synthase